MSQHRPSKVGWFWLCEAMALSQWFTAMSFKSKRVLVARAFNSFTAACTPVLVPPAPQ